MPKIPGQETWQQRVDRLLAQALKASPLESSSVTDGLVQFIGGMLQGLAGAVFEWVGTFNLTGPFTATGTSTFRGPVAITGETGTLDVEADAKFGGNTEIGENLDVTAETRLRGKTTVEDDLEVTESGKVKVGTSMTLDPTVAAGAVVFSNGAQVFTDADTIQLYLGNGVAQISNDYAKLQWGGTTVRIDVDGIHLSGASAETQYDIEVGRDLKVPGVSNAPLGVTLTAIGVDEATGTFYLMS